MTILDRIQRIAKANFNNLLDKAEAPGKMLRQTVRETEDALKSAKVATAEFATTLKKSERERDQLKRLAAEWQNKAAEAVRNGQDDLARRALAEKQAAEERIRSLEPVIAERTARYAELRTSLSELQRRLDDARARLADLESRKQAADARKVIDTHLGSAAGAGSDSGFDKFESEVLHSEASADIASDMRSNPGALDRELADKTRELSVESELAAMKKNLDEKK